MLSLAVYTQVLGRPARTAVPLSPAVADTVDRVSDAAEMHHVAVKAFTQALWYSIWDGGMLTDELRAPLNGLSVLPQDRLGFWGRMSPNVERRSSLKDARKLPEMRDTVPKDGTDHTREGELAEGYLAMQGTRAYVSTALKHLTTAATAAADPTVVKLYRGELYALEGYAEILLAAWRVTMRGS
jgi:hypothetical protein